MFDMDSSSVVRSLIDIFAFRQGISTSLTLWLNFRSSLVDGEVEESGELKHDRFPQLANGKGPNRTHAQWKFTNVYHLTRW